MPNLNTLILTAADWKVALNIPGVGVSMLQTMDSISWEDSVENELIYAVGNQYAIGNKQNAFKFSGSFSLQNGEMDQVLSNAGLKSATQVPGAILSITSLTGGPSYTYINMCLNTSKVSVKAKDKETLVSIDWTATNVI